MVKLSLAKFKRQLVADCSALPLVQTASDLVFGEGKVGARVLIVGEAPGAQEALTGRPFVGRSGQLLRRTLAEVGVAEADLYITNLVKARPPANRDPSKAEIAAYLPYLQQEIALIKPQIMVTLGRHSLGQFWPGAKISLVHGQWHELTEFGFPLKLLPCYHPAAALRGRKVRAFFEVDLAKIPLVLD